MGNFRGKKERTDPRAEVNVRKERSKNDPQVQASVYLEQHKILPMFEMLGQALVTEQPADPRAFLVRQLEALKSAQDKTSPLNFFTDEEIDTLYSMYDVSKQGITPQQCREALNAIGLENVKVPAGPPSKRFQLADFKALVP